MVVGGDVRMGKVCSRFHVAGGTVLLDCGVGVDDVLRCCAGDEVMIVVVGIDGGVGRRWGGGGGGGGGGGVGFVCGGGGGVLGGVGATRGRYVVNW